MDPSFYGTFVVIAGISLLIMQGFIILSALKLTRGYFDTLTKVIMSNTDVHMGLWKAQQGTADSVIICLRMISTMADTHLDFMNAERDRLKAEAPVMFFGMDMAKPGADVCVGKDVPDPFEEIDEVMNEEYECENTPKCGCVVCALKESFREEKIALP